MLRTYQIIAFCLFTQLAAFKAYSEDKINWQNWSKENFTQAKKTNKLVYLNLEAIWCHWCHVIEEKTYSQKEVIELLNKSFIAVKVDQDSFPELSLRYRDYGWPATIIFNSKGEEIEKLSGFYEAPKLIQILNDSVKNPLPKSKKEAIEQDYTTTSTSLNKEYKEKLLKEHYESLDTETGGLRTAHKYLDFETIEYSFLMASQKNEKDAEFVKTSLNSNLKLLDPVWGGVYQYSTKKSWDNAHFEKIMHSQTDNIKLYAYADSFWDNEIFNKSAMAIYSYIKNFLTSPEGAFYTSQDADLIKGQHSKEFFSLSDSERRKKGIPAIDKNIYTRENGWVITALMALYAATGNQSVYDDAAKSAELIIQNRTIEDGGFKHGENTNQGIFLGDSLSMAEAFLSLYEKNGDRKWLKLSAETSGFIAQNFNDQSNSSAGYFSMKQNKDQILKPYKNLNENLHVARHFNLLFHYTGDKKYQDLSKAAAQYAFNPASGNNRINDSGILTADFELNNDPLHITIVGHKDDPASKLLFNAALKYFSIYKRTEWWDKREGPMPNPDVEYPQMQKPAAFICTNKRCSLPIFKPEKIAETIKLFQNKD